jgi:CRP-like cAMP-binding protein
VEVRVGAGGAQTTVARLGERSFFGEMSLMTGAPRAATVVAVDDVVVYFIEKSDFQDLMTNNPRLAEQVAESLALRQMGLKQSTAAIPPAEMKEKSRDVLDKIRRFFRF